MYMVKKKHKQSAGGLLIPQQFGSSSTPDLERGQLVRSIAGRDKGSYYLVVGREDDTLFLADGRKRGMQNPKKKNARHVQKFNRVAADPLEQATERPFRDEEIRAAMRKLLNEEEGEYV